MCDTPTTRSWVRVPKANWLSKKRSAWVKGDDKCAPVHPAVNEYLARDKDSTLTVFGLAWRLKARKRVYTLEGVAHVMDAIGLPEVVKCKAL